MIIKGKFARKLYIFYTISFNDWKSGGYILLEEISNNIYQRWAFDRNGQYWRKEGMHGRDDGYAIKFHALRKSDIIPLTEGEIYYIEQNYGYPHEKPLDF